ncbi:zinc finger protein 142 [Neoarius graeffei]|uniref:zinc finger protein 142 n=1 Tax=Neoarius graeffei TaxID=443677 RepID=UPI00298C6A3A|nr:zinc finger protein 142 [Neoarius graeffei]XP_060786232.1 zinc finger protein 142 [Neoarius graeffei]
MEEQKLDVCNEEQLYNSVQNETGTETSNKAGNEEKDINDTACNKNSRKKRTIQKKISPALSQDEEVETDTPQPRKGAKASVRQRKTSVVSVQDHVAEGTEHMFRTHICTECRRCFKTRSHLMEHMRLHFPDPSLQCPTCKHYFTSKSKLRIHMLRESGEKLHRCQLCEYAAVERNTLHRHITSVHGHQGKKDAHQDLYTCPTCQKSFHQSQALKSHMKSHHITQNGQPLACFYQGCVFQSTDKKLLQKHALDAHGIKAIKCHHHACCALFGSKEDMEVHFRTHQAFHCTHCDFSCSNKSRLQQHKRQGHAGETQLRCSFCPFTTFNPVVFNQHVGHLHANEKTNKCPECSFMTAHKRVLKRHMLVHTGEKPHKCSLCEFRCRDETYLSKHMLTHSEDKQHMCSECGYVTKWKHYLNVHMRKHTGDLRYKCNQCMYRCHRVDQLNSHKLRHQAKTLICEVCAYSCKRKTELLKHMQIKHLTVKDHQLPVFQCKFCNYTTKYRQSLHSHENSKHTRTKEFCCALCPYTTFSNTALFLHKRKAHGYIPGDVKWLETYAEKERQSNSVDAIQNFYSAFEENSGGQVDSCSDSKNIKQAESQNMTNDVSSQIHNSCETTNDPENVSTVEHQVSSVADAVGEETNNITEDQPVIQLTLLQNTENAHTGPLENLEITSTNIPVAESPRSHTTYEALQVSNEPESAEEDGAMSDCEEASVNEEQALNQGHEMLIKESQTSAAQQAISSETPLAEAACSETLLQVMRRQDKDQAKALILEGRVQMLVVQTQDNVYRCDHCSYVTRKRTALARHCRSSCQVMKAALRCQDCGLHFKQLRSFNTHRLRKCHSLQKKNRMLSTSRDSEIAQEKYKSYNQNATRSMVSAVTVTDPCEENVQTSTANSKSVQEEKNTQNNHSLTESKSLAICESYDYLEEDGKFTCIKCSFSCSRKATIARHCTACSRSTPKRNLTVNEAASEANEEQSEQDKELEQRDGENQGDLGEKIKTTKRFSCSNCPFVCQQRRALTSHEKRGCLKPGELQCQKCSFVARSEKSLSQHFLGHGKDKRHKRGKQTQLCCKLCCFTCKQERRMSQHVTLKHEGIRPFCCRFCDFSTARRHRLAAHESMHTGIGRHQCELCNQTFGTSSKLRLHRQRIHDKQATHFCSLCDYKGYNPTDISRHTLSCHTGELSHKCSQCDYCFSSDIALKQHHKRSHQSANTHYCSQCNFSCDSDSVLKAHLQSKHPQNEKATLQETGSHTQPDPEKRSKASVTQQCPDCPFTTAKKLSLIQHILDEHESGHDEGKILKCDICGFSCFHQLVFDQHVRSHGGTCLYKCTECDFSTRNGQKITWHIRVHTGEKPYHCEKCSYTCVDPSRLKYHMRIHQDERKYLCPECGYKCKWVNQLKYHMTKHSGAKSYSCEECEYRTNRADALRVHRETRHRDMRSFICEKCGKAFKTRFLLKTHQKRHSDERPYVCSECQRGFRWPAGLRHHFLSHTNQLPFCCLYCSYRAKQKFQVVKHLRRHHPDKSMQNGVVKDPNTSIVPLQKARLVPKNEVHTESKEVIEGEKETDEL